MEFGGCVLRMERLRGVLRPPSRMLDFGLMIETKVVTTGIFSWVSGYPNQVIKARLAR